MARVSTSVASVGETGGNVGVVIRYAPATFDDDGISQGFHAGSQHRCGNNSRFGIECVIDFAIRMDAWTDNRLRSGGSQLDDHRSVFGISVFFCGCSVSRCTSDATLARKAVR